jgi:hypothetical protein
MGAHTHQQGSLYDHPALPSNKQSEDSAVSSFAYSANRPGNRRGRMPWKGKKQYYVPGFPDLSKMEWSGAFRRGRGLSVHFATEHKLAWRPRMRGIR